MGPWQPFSADIFRTQPGALWASLEGNFRQVADNSGDGSGDNNGLALCDGTGQCFS